MTQTSVVSRAPFAEEVRSRRRSESQAWLDASGIATAPTDDLPDLHALVEAAILAPSPDNNQPWKFVSGDECLDVHLDLARSLPSDVNHMFDLTAIGAAVENICIASREQGFEPHVELLSVDEAFEHHDSRAASGTIPVARMRWSRGARPDRLYPLLSQRRTNRRWYSTEPIAPEILSELTAEVAKFAGVAIRWLTSRPEIWQFAWLVGETDRMRFEKKEFHDELYKQIRFTPEEAEATGDGLDIRTLALPPGGKLVLKSLRNWRMLSFANRLGASRMLALPSVPQVVRSAAVGICFAETSGNGYVCGGRALQRLWIRATEQGLALHPLGSLPIYLQHESNSGQASLNHRVGELVAPRNSAQMQIAFRIGTVA